MLLPSLLCLALTLAPAGGRTSDLQTSDSINSVLAKVRMSLPRILKSSRRPPPNLRKNTNNFRKNPFQFTFRKCHNIFYLSLFNKNVLNNAK